MTNNNEFYQKGINIKEIDTPSIIVDLDIAENNINKMQKFANENNVSMRPHSKTNKSPYWAKKQIKAGAIGICCAKLGEAEVMAENGIPEILIPNQIVGAKKKINSGIKEVKNYYCSGRFVQCGRTIKNIFRK